MLDLEGAAGPADVAVVGSASEVEQYLRDLESAGATEVYATIFGSQAEQVLARFHRDDRLMLWFDFFNHDNDEVVESMAAMVHQVLPRLAAAGVPVPAEPARVGR